MTDAAVPPAPEGRPGAKLKAAPVLAADGRPLKRSLARALRMQKLRALALIAPLLLFVLITFIAPIADMLFRSVENQIVSNTLPQTTERARGLGQHHRGGAGRSGVRGAVLRHVPGRRGQGAHQAGQPPELRADRDLVAVPLDRARCRQDRRGVPGRAQGAEPALERCRLLVCADDRQSRGSARHRAGQRAAQAAERAGFGHL